jgi:hypothetical protein
MDGALEARHLLLRQGIPNQALNRAQQLMLFRRHQRHRMAIATGAAGAADAVHIVLRLVG